MTKTLSVALDLALNAAWFAALYTISFVAFTWLRTL